MTPREVLVAARRCMRDARWGHGGSGAPDGDEWVWEEDGYAVGDPDAPDTRLFHAPSKVAEQICDGHNAHIFLLAALSELYELGRQESIEDGDLEAAQANARAALLKARGGQ